MSTPMCGSTFSACANGVASCTTTCIAPWPGSAPTRLTVSPMLPANAPVLAALALPDFYAITHAGEIGVDAQLHGPGSRTGSRPAAGAAARAGARWRRAGAAFVHAAVDLCHHYGARVLVNGDPGWR
jgi:8-oxo-dGTP diphosphatase